MTCPRPSTKSPTNLRSRKAIRSTSTLSLSTIRELRTSTSRPSTGAITPLPMTARSPNTPGPPAPPFPTTAALNPRPSLCRRRHLHGHRDPQGRRRQRSPVTQTFTVTVEAVPITIDPLDNQSVSEGDSLQLNGPDESSTSMLKARWIAISPASTGATALSAGRPWCKFPSTAARPAPPFPTTARCSCPTISMPSRHLHRRGQHYRP